MEHKGIILLVEDNAALNDANSRALRLQNYKVMTALTLDAARERLAEREPDIILLDVMLPDGDGFDFCREIREKTTAHILFLTAKTAQEDITRGLADGGDDYIVKPFRLPELLARVDAAMRRRGMDRAAAQVIKKGPLTLDTLASRAFMDGVDLLLTLREFALLRLLILNENSIISAEELYQKTWGQPIGGDKNSLHAVVSKLRVKLTETGYTVSFLRGQGYAFKKN